MFLNNIKNGLRYFASFIPIEYCFTLFDLIRLERLKKKINNIGKGCMFSPEFIVMTPSNLIIEDNVSFGRGVRIMGAGNVLIKQGAMIANGVTILTTTHDSRAENMKSTAIHQDVTIGEMCWIGANAIILPGVSIHRNAIVGAGAIVTKDVEEGGVVVGPAAKMIRKRLS